VPESEKDWHPRSNGQVLDLVHPSLYPIVYGRTLSYPEDCGERDPSKLQLRLKPPNFDLQDTYCISKRFQWLPTDFIVSNDGKSVKSNGYINNLHPIEHAELHKTIEQLIAAYIPLFERALTDSLPDNKVIPERTNNNGYCYDNKGYDPAPRYTLWEEGFGEKYQQWHSKRPFIVPQVVEGGYELRSLEKREVKYTLAGRTIQVIVKLANIHLVSLNVQCRGYELRRQPIDPDTRQACVRWWLLAH
jgi:hypothetical protein